MRKQLILLLITITAALVVANGTVLAATKLKLDQQNSDTSNPAFGGNHLDGYGSLVQTFTAGMTGDLDKVSVYLCNCGNIDTGGQVEADIYALDSSGDPSQIIGVGTVPLKKLHVPPGSYGWVDIPLSRPAYVQAGTSYALDLSPQLTSAGVAWGDTFGNPYAQGSFKQRDCYSGCWHDVGNGDADAFFKTFVGPDKPLHVTYEIPNPGEKNSYSGTWIWAGFSEPVDPSTVNTSTIELFEWNSQEKKWQQKTDTSVKCLYIDSLCLGAYISYPQSRLDENTKYEAEVTTGLKDLSGNALAKNKKWTFTTD